MGTLPANEATGFFDKHAKAAGYRVNLEDYLRELSPEIIEDLAEVFLPHLLRCGVVEVAHGLRLHSLGFLSRLGLCFCRRSFPLSRRGRHSLSARGRQHTRASHQAAAEQCSSCYCRFHAYFLRLRD